MATQVYVNPFTYDTLNLKLQGKISSIFQQWWDRIQVGRNVQNIERALKVLTLMSTFLPYVKEEDYDKVDSIISQYSNIIE